MKKQDGIQSLRALACLLVLCQHSMYFACSVVGMDYRPLLMINFGRIGVSLFFVISGYVMGSCLEQGKWFLWNRCKRIFPPFWAAIAISGLLVPGGDASWHFDWSSAALIPPSVLNNSYWIPYWTLCYEFAFYCALYVVILCRLSKTHTLYLCLMWLATVVGVDAYRPIGDVDIPEVFIQFAQPGWQILLSPYCIFFIAGLIYSLTQAASIYRMPTLPLLLISLVSWSIGNNLRLPSPCNMFLLQSASFVCLIAAVKAIRTPSWLVKTGDFSYGIYLVHMVLIGALLTWQGHLLQRTSLAGVFFLLLCTCAAGGVFFGWIEYGLYKRMGGAK